MSRDRVPILQRLSQNIRQGSIIDVYALVEDLKHEFPDISEAELVRIVSEEVVLANGNAVWEKKVARR
jgi:hypothetical protein